MSKPGWRTSEFWATAASVLAGVGGAAAALAAAPVAGPVAIIAGTVAGVAAALASSAYAISRAWVKAAEARGGSAPAAEPDAPPEIKIPPRPRT